MESLTDLIDSYEAQGKKIGDCKDTYESLKEFSDYLAKPDSFSINKDDIAYATDIIEKIKAEDEHTTSKLAHEIVYRYISSVGGFEDKRYSLYDSFNLLNSDEDSAEESAIKILTEAGQGVIDVMLTKIESLYSIVNSFDHENPRHYFNNALAPLKANLEWVKKEIK